jgi:tellurite resistance protein TerC
MTQMLLWLIFIILFITVFTADMIVTDHRKGTIRIRTALFWTGIWISTAFLFAGIIAFLLPSDTAGAGLLNSNSIDFITGYLVEFSLSIDNLFVFIIVFDKMRIPSANQPHILKWGIIGAIVFRVVFILAGIELLKTFSFMIYIFGLILVLTAIKITFSGESKFDPDKSLVVKTLYKFLNVKEVNDKPSFFIQEGGKKFVTVSFITVCILELMDVLFAIDSIPAILAITSNSFIAITSNLFAILGLRSMYFALSGLLGLFRYLKYGITLILFFIGVKMLVSNWVHITSAWSLVIVLSIIIISIIISLLHKEKSK